MGNAAVLEVVGGKYPWLTTAGEDVTARIAVVMAAGTYVPALKPWHRAVVPVNSLDWSL